MEYRLAKKSDAAAIAILHATSWQNAYANILDREYLQTQVVEDRTQLWKIRFETPQPNQRVIVATKDERVLGFICVFVQQHQQRGSLIDNLHVSPEVQRQGIGRQLLAEVCNWCQGIAPNEGIYLEVLAENHGARHYYEKLGAINAETATWRAPCGTDVKEYVYAWPSSTNLQSHILNRCSPSESTANRMFT